LQIDFQMALRLNTFPPHLQAEFERITEEAGLDAKTMLPYQLPKGYRTLLFSHWD